MAKYLTTRQVAAIFHVHPNTVVLWANDGRLPCVRTPGRHRRFDPADVDRLVAETAGSTRAGGADSAGAA